MKDEKSKDEKMVEFDINSQPYEEPKGRITYDRIVALAYPDFATFPQATYSILFERGSADHAQGTLTKGSSVQLMEGMRFRAKRTGES